MKNSIRAKISHSYGITWTETLCQLHHRDRLARFGYTYFEEIAHGHGVIVEITEDAPAKELQDDLVEDLIAIVTSFAARLYGRRSKRFQALKQRVTKTAEPKKSTRIKKKRTNKK
jgi:predicted site-specific integrase-resolvase